MECICKASIYVLLLASTSLGASDYLLPASQYGRVNIDLPQSLLAVKESNISGNANYEPLANAPPQDPLRQRSLPVGRLDILYEEGASTCTASIISARLILSNQHCVPGTGEHGAVKEATLLMGFYSQTDTSGTKRYTVEPSPLYADAGLDFALLRVRGNPAASWGTVQLSRRDPYPGESLLIMHHPLGLPLHVTRGRCRAASPTAIDSTDIFHTCDTEGGSSGSPILSFDGETVLGVHFSGVYGNQLFNRGKRLAAIADKYPAVASLIGTTATGSMPASNSPTAGSKAPSNRSPTEAITIDLSATHGKADVFLKSSFTSERAMDEAGCASIKRILKQDAQDRCSDRNATVSELDFDGCEYTGRSVRRYEVSATVTCSPGNR